MKHCALSGHDFSMIGAALRAERGVALHDRVAWRVQSVVAQRATYGDGPVDTPASSMRTAVIVPASELKAQSVARSMRFARPVAGASIAAGVAALFDSGFAPRTILKRCPPPIG